MTLNKHFLIEILQYVLLVLVFFVAAIAFSKVFDPLYRFLIILAVSVFYFLWGIWHHYHKDRLNKHIILEYFLVALIVVLLSALGLGLIRFF